MSTKPEDWFSTDLTKGLSRVYSNAFVKTFVDAEEYYTDLRAEVEATGDGGQICWIGFEAHGDTPMPAKLSTKTLKNFPPRPPEKDSDKTWFDLLKSASDERGVPIRALLNLHPKPDLNPAAPKKYKVANFDLVEKLNSLQNCLAINDFRYLAMNGTHHQKMVLVYNKKGLSAYVGTCDVELARIQNCWCEVQCKVTGDAAAELYEVFHRRWVEHTALFKRAAFADNSIKPIASLKFTAPVSGNFLTQISTTYGNPGRLNPFNTYLISGQPPWQVVNQPHRILLHSDSLLGSTGLLLSGAPIFFGNDFFTEVDAKARLPIQDAARQDRTYAFAKDGHTGVYEAIKKAIETCKEYIYLEDQYLISDVAMGKLKSLLDLLKEKLRDPLFKKLIIFCTRIDDINDELQFTAWSHRKNFVDSLLRVDYNKVVVCQYKSRQVLGTSFGEPHQGAFYIHSKTWIFDDLFLITGSANCNRRGYCHDSELDIGVYDQNKQFVRELRIRIWKNRLNTQGIAKDPLETAHLNDFLSAAKYWETPKNFGLTIESNREKSLEPIKYPDLDVNSYKAKVTGQPGMGAVSSGFMDKLKMIGLWDYVVDPDGT